MSTPRLGAPELTLNQAVPETTVNEQVRYLEGFANSPHFKSRANNPAQPGSPSDGDMYLLTGTPTGTNWAGQGGKIALFISTAWVFITAKEGFFGWVDDENVIIAYNGATWSTIPTGNPTESIIIACSDETTAITAGTGKVTFRMPYAFTLSSVKASVTTAPTGSGITIDINEAGSTILSTKITIAAGSKTSVGGTPAVISDTALADDAEITIDFDGVGSTIAGTGVKVYLIGSRT